MADLRVVYDPETMQADLAWDGTTLATGDDLETAVYLSLFTDARARDDDITPSGDGRRRGWWGDAVPPTILGVQVDNDRFGSRLWLLARELQLPSALVRARAYAVEALQWLLDDGVAAAVDVVASWPRDEWLLLTVTVTRPDGAAESYAWEANWQAEAVRLAGMA